MFKISCSTLNNHFKLINQLIRQSSSLPVITEKRDETLIITINRPEKRNAVNSEVASLLLKAFQQLDSDADVKVAILTGRGGNFCSGYDLAEVANAKDPQKIIRRAAMGPTHLVTSKPTIAAIDGYCVAGGLELALLCDLRVIEDTAVLGVFNRRFGVPLIDGGTARLPKIIGLGRALDLILTGRAIDGREALNIGLATKMCSTGCCLGNAINLASSLTKFNQDSLITDKRSTYYSSFDATSLSDALEYEHQNGVKVMNVAIKGASSFVNDNKGKHGSFALDDLDELMKIRQKKSKLIDE